MDTRQHLRLLQVTYAAQLADAVTRYGQAGILDQVTAAKRVERRAGGATQAAQLGITTPEAAFTTSAEIFGCADWTAGEARGGGVEAHATHCLLCAMVRKLDGPSPCRLFCLDPIEAMVVGLQPDTQLEVEETLFDGEQCRVRVRTRP